MPKPLKIAVYSGEIPSTTFIERLIKGLSDQGHAIYLFGYQTRKITYANSNIFIRSYTGNRLHKFYILLKYSLLLFFFRNSEKKILDAYIKVNSKNHILSKVKYYPVLWHKPDIFHLQWAKSIGDWSWVQQFGIKMVVSLRGTHISISPHSVTGLAALYRSTFPKMDGFHAVSKAISLEAQRYGANPALIQVVYSGLSKSQLLNSGVKENANFKILSVGRNHWLKGYNYALDALKILLDKGCPVSYTVIGAKGSEELEFQKTELGLNACVNLLDAVPFVAVQRMMQEADLVLLPSVEEGIANVVLEAMQLGTLVLTTNCGGMEEVVRDGENGFVVPVRNPHHMAEAIQRIMGLNEVQRLRILTAAQETIQLQHAEEKMIADMISLYKKVLQL